MQLLHSLPFPVRVDTPSRKLIEVLVIVGGNTLPELGGRLPLGVIPTSTPNAQWSKKIHQCL